MHMMKIDKTEYSRRIDSVGRIGIPIEIRRQYKMDQGKEYSYSIISYEGVDYLALELGEKAKTEEELLAIIHELEKQIKR